MITVEQLKDINRLIPGEDERARLRRRLVQLLADANGRLGLPSLVETLGGGWGAVVAEARQWDGLRWSGVGNGTTVWLAPWLAARFGLVPKPACPPPARLDGQDEDEPSAYHQPSLAERLHTVTAAARPAPLPTARAAEVDSLAGVRAAVARAGKSVATVAEALAHAYPDAAVVSLTPTVLARDCAGTLA